jgi:hypothetical protein
MKVAEAQELWSPATTYLNTASYGLPPRPAWDALRAPSTTGTAGRRAGSTGESPARTHARPSHGSSACRAESVAIGPNVSTLVGLVAASIPNGSRVLAPDVEFTSELFPFLVQEHRG